MPRACDPQLHPVGDPRRDLHRDHRVAGIDRTAEPVGSLDLHDVRQLRGLQQRREPGGDVKIQLRLAGGARERPRVRAAMAGVQHDGIHQLGALDFAGGTVVHISAGCAALAGAIVLKSRRSKLEQHEIPPANIPYVLIGTGLLWFGWFGFNAGSALGANSLAINAFATTNTAAAAAGLAWMFFDVMRGKKPSVLGFCIGAVVGLVAITPAAGFVGIPQSIFIGLVAAIISNAASHAFKLSRVDDTLDVFPCHGIGGIVGMLMTGIFASKGVNAGGNDGLFYGNPAFFLTQLKAMLIVVAYSFTVSFLIFKFISIIMPLRVTEEDEELGLDATQHDEKYGRNPLKA